MTNLTNEARPATDHRGAIAVGRRRSPLRWLPWLALALLALVGLSVAVLLANVNDENDDPGLELRDDESGGADQGSGRGTTATSVAAAGDTPPDGALRAGDTALLPVPATGLSPLSGTDVRAEGVTVESVVADEGFWVGSSAEERVFVFLTPQARTRQGESPFQVRAGQRVNLQGALRPVPRDITPFGVDALEGADQLRQQGQYVEATQIALT